MTRTIKIASRSTLVSSTDLINGVNLIQAALRNEFGAAWPEAQNVQLVVSSTPYVGDEIVWLLDDEKGADFLGEHMMDNMGHPVGVVLVKPSLSEPGGWLATLSHEVFEQVVDKFINLGVLAIFKNKMAYMAYETADPVENDTYNGGLSNFILPSWFVPGSAGPWDHLGKLAGPLTYDAGGYVSYFDFTTNSWQQAFGRAHTGNKHKRSRMTRRNSHPSKLFASTGLSINSLESSLRNLLTSLSHLEVRMATTLDDILGVVQQESTVISGLGALISGLEQQVTDIASGKLTVVQQDELNQVFAVAKQNLAAMMTALTTAPGGTPAPATPAAPVPAVPPTAAHAEEHHEEPKH